MSYRLDAKQLFLTYPKCNILPGTALSLLEIICERHKIEKYIVAQEKHQDGTDHLHVWLRLTKRFNTRNPRAFDLEWDGVNYHGNYQPCRRASAVQKYCQKGGNFVTNMDDCTTKSSSIWSEAIQAAKENGRKEALTMLENDSVAARSILIHREAIVRNLTAMSTRVKPPLFSLDMFPAWNPNWWEKGQKTMILHGKSGCGKTCLAKAILPTALFVTHMDQLKNFDPEMNEGLIFDDMNFNHQPREAQIHLMDCYDDRTLHVRYTTAEIPAGTPKIITTNLPPMQVCLLWDEAIKRRVDVIEMLAIDNFKPDQDYTPAPELNLENWLNTDFIE